MTVDVFSHVLQQHDRHGRHRAAAERGGHLHVQGEEVPGAAQGPEGPLFRDAGPLPVPGKLLSPGR